MFQKSRTDIATTTAATNWTATEKEGYHPHGRTRTQSVQHRVEPSRGKAKPQLCTVRWGKSISWEWGGAKSSQHKQKRKETHLIEPVVESVDAVEDCGQQEVEQGPQLREVVLRTKRRKRHKTRAGRAGRIREVCECLSLFDFFPDVSLRQQQQNSREQHEKIRKKSRNKTRKHNALATRGTHARTYTMSFPILQHLEEKKNVPAEECP